jgi:hypothetical protein
MVPGMLYGSVVEHVDMSVDEMPSILVRLIGLRVRLAARDPLAGSADGSWDWDDLIAPQDTRGCAYVSLDDARNLGTSCQPVERVDTREDHGSPDVFTLHLADTESSLSHRRSLGGRVACDARPL